MTKYCLIAEFIGRKYHLAAVAAKIRLSVIAKAYIKDLAAGMTDSGIKIDKQTTLNKTGRPTLAHDVSSG